MERSEILTAMGELKLYGMKAAYDEILTTAIKRQHEPHRIVGDLLAAEINEKQARSIRYQAQSPHKPKNGQLTEQGCTYRKIWLQRSVDGRQRNATRKPLIELKTFCAKQTKVCATRRG